MVRKDDDVGSHDSSRSYLADVVTEHGRKIDDLIRKTERDNVALETLLKADERAREHRERMFRELEAARSEASQLMQSTVAIQTDVTKLIKTVNDIEGERRDRATIFAFVGKSAKVAWTLFGAALTALAATIWKAWQGQPPPHP